MTALVEQPAAVCDCGRSSHAPWCASQVEWYSTPWGATSLVAEYFAVTVLAVEEPGGAILWWTVTVRTTLYAPLPEWKWSAAFDSQELAQEAALVAVRTRLTAEEVES
ncbi:hypothetical protein SEA_CLOWN_94 [Gordonia phage Clown]|uniref:Uncharacterized protein n=1 Tax=Gordonia phage Clown TaxID=2759393 RepID=A0A7L7SI32_9CAUD|nr:hypothetical protein KNV25_gp94 [Gordonia phage Clown]QOC56092.1 hypothetical protein SEA_CLOWN_94 [Gordonia phage Clown]